jgi:hypothetical protein
MTTNDTDRRDVLAATAIRVLVTAYIGALIVAGCWLVNVYLDLVGSW